MKNPNPDPEKHKDIPVWNAENWLYEDIEIGKRIRSIRRTISEGESMQFNALVLDMHPYVADEIFAKEEGVFGRRLIAGAMVFSVGLGLVATNCVNSFSYGYDKLRFIKPVFIGDTIYTIMEKTLDLKPSLHEILQVVSMTPFEKVGSSTVSATHRGGARTKQQSNGSKSSADFQSAQGCRAGIESKQTGSLRYFMRLNPEKLDS